MKSILTMIGIYLDRLRMMAESRKKSVAGNCGCWLVFVYKVPRSLAITRKRNHWI